MVSRGEVWLVTLDPTVGSEIKKTRPCVVVSPDEINEHLRNVIIAPMTGGSRPAPYRMETVFDGRPGRVLLDQIRTVDKRRLVRKIGELENPALMAALEMLSKMFAA